MATKTNPDLLTRREAAILAEVPLNTVDKAIEEKVVKVWRRKTATLLEGDDVITLAVIYKAGLPLQRKSKQEIRHWLHEARPHASTKTEELYLSDVLVVRINQTCRTIAKQLSRYLKDRDRFVESNPEVMGGDPVIVGTRLPVRAVAKRIEHGDSIEDLQEEYPDIPRKAFDAALIYAQSHPRRGRPARPWRDV